MRYTVLFDWLISILKQLNWEHFLLYISLTFLLRKLVKRKVIFWEFFGGLVFRTLQEEKEII